jgi:hypothetical protein
MVISQGCQDAAKMAAPDLLGLAGAPSGDSGNDRRVFT